MEKTMDDYWDDVADEVSSALAITWDECHKIYVLMDDEQLAIMDGYGYDLVDVSTLRDPVEKVRSVFQVLKGFLDSKEEDGE